MLAAETDSGPRLFSCRPPPHARWLQTFLSIGSWTISSLEATQIESFASS